MIDVNMYWLGIDIGTGGTRALLIDGAGREVAAVTAPHEEMRMEHPLWAEQRPENWVDAAGIAIRAALAKSGVRGQDIRAVGLSGQMHGLVILDSSNAVIRPSLIWCDQRSQAQVDHVNRKLGAEKILKAIANPVLTGFTLPKLLWVRDNEPHHFERVRRLLLPKDYVRFWLTGEFATEVSDASGTALLDVVRRCWSFEMVDGLGLDREILPALYESSDTTGTISARAAELTGLAAGTPVVGGAGDQAAGAVGNGIVEPGIASCTLGHFGRRIRPYRHPLLGFSGTRAHLLSRGPQQMARDGCHSGRGAESAMVPQPAGSRQHLRRTHGRGLPPRRQARRAFSGCLT